MGTRRRNHVLDDTWDYYFQNKDILTQTDMSYKSSYISYSIFEKEAVQNKLKKQMEHYDIANKDIIVLQHQLLQKQM
jgi:catalase (peroxidase I)